MKFRVMLTLYVGHVPIRQNKITLLIMNQLTISIHFPEVESPAREIRVEYQARHVAFLEVRRLKFMGHVSVSLSFVHGIMHDNFRGASSPKQAGNENRSPVVPHLNAWEKNC